jgi:hypothetical protein
VAYGSIVGGLVRAERSADARSCRNPEDNQEKESERCAASRRQGSIWARSQQRGPAMRELEFEKINAVLDRAQFAIRQIQGKVDELARKKAAAQTPEEIAAVDLVADELLLQLRKVSDAIHTGNPAPHLRLVSDTE